MRYLYNTPIKSLKQTEKGDRFIVKILGEEKDKSVFLMDNLGRIFDFGYKNISERLFDEFFDAQIDIFNYVLIDKNGREIFRYSHKSDIGSFNDGIAVFESREDNHNYFLTENGELLGQEFEDVEGFFNGFGSVKLINGKYVLVDRDMLVVSPEFDYIVPFINENYTIANINGKVCVIDRYFNIVSDCIIDKSGKAEPYSKIIEIDENNIITHQKKDENGENKYCYASIDGKQLGDYHLIDFGFVNGASKVYDLDGGIRYVDLSGKYISNTPYINCGNFVNGLAVVGACDANGEFVFAYLKKDGTLMKFDLPKTKANAGYDGVWFSYASDFSEGTGLVMFDGNKRYPVTSEGKVLKGYSLLESYNSGLASYQTKNKKYTYVDKNNYSFAIEFDTAFAFRGNLAVVKNDGVYDAVSVSEVLLSEISQISERIEQNPKFIMMLPDKIFKDEKLVMDLISLAEQIAKEKNNKDYLAVQEKIRKNVESKIERKIENNKVLGE